MFTAVIVSVSIVAGSKPDARSVPGADRSPAAGSATDSCDCTKAAGCTPTASAKVRRSGDDGSASEAVVAPSPSDATAGSADAPKEMELLFRPSPEISWFSPSCSLEPDESCTTATLPFLDDPNHCIDPARTSCEARCAGNTCPCPHLRPPLPRHDPVASKNCSPQLPGGLAADHSPSSATLARRTRADGANALTGAKRSHASEAQRGTAVTMSLAGGARRIQNVTPTMPSR